MRLVNLPMLYRNWKCELLLHGQLSIHGSSSVVFGSGIIKFPSTDSRTLNPPVEFIDCSYIFWNIDFEESRSPGNKAKLSTTIIDQQKYWLWVEKD